MSLIRLFLLLGLVVAWGDAGPGIDPIGGLRTRADEGAGLDPFGSKGGSCIDPNGCYSAALNGDEGNGLDPHG
jgi:hypothetical protein